MDFAQRAARNEDVFRSVNARIEEGAAMHRVAGLVPYHCECASVSCFEKISLPPADYERIVAERYRFIVAPGHQNEAVEQVVEDHGPYFVVEQVGEAREQLDRDHPQTWHAGR